MTVAVKPKTKDKITFVIQSRGILDRDPKTGKRFSGGRVRWSKWENWQNSNDNGQNFRQAVRYVNKRLQEDHLGSIIVIRKIKNGYATQQYIKLYQCKFGHDGKYFRQYEGMLGDYWRRKAGLPFIKAG